MACFDSRILFVVVLLCGFSKTLSAKPLTLAQKASILAYAKKMADAKKIAPPELVDTGAARVPSPDVLKPIPPSRVSSAFSSPTHSFVSSTTAISHLSTLDDSADKKRRSSDTTMLDEPSIPDDRHSVSAPSSRSPSRAGSLQVFPLGGAGAEVASSRAIVLRRPEDSPSFVHAIDQIAAAVVRRLHNPSFSSSGGESESDGEVDWDAPHLPPDSSRTFKNIKVFESICRLCSSSFILYKNSRYCLLVGAASEGPDVDGVPPPCLQVLLIVNPQTARKFDVEYWAEYTQHDPDAWAYSNMLATVLEFLGKQMRILGLLSSRSERENGGSETATIGSPHRQCWSTRLCPAGDFLRRVELDEACLLFNSRLWNDLFRIFVKKMWVKKYGNVGHARDPLACWNHLMSHNAQFKDLFEEWNRRYNEYFGVACGEDSLSRLVSEFPQRDGWTGEKPFWLKTDRWLT